jgi:type II secretory ATPase GspE/PulE/Tfp pilus assembly ATPase PilB-like protein
MPETTSITTRVLDTLAQGGLITIEQLGVVQDASGDGRSAGDVLLERGLVSSAEVGKVLEDDLGVPRVDLSSYAPDDSALSLVPPAVARHRRILPLFEIEGALTVAIGDAMDVFALDEVAEELGVEIDPVLTDPTSLMGALAQYYDVRADAQAEAAASVAAPEAAAAEEVPEAGAFFDETAAPLEELEIPGPINPDVEPPPPPPSAEELAEGAFAAAAPVEAHTMEDVAAAVTAEGSSIDLDVLAVADPRKTALLVTDILDDAAARGATRIHLLPYKDDFFLVYRIDGRLEKVAAAPLSMQGALVEALKSFAKLGAVPPSLPALGRVHAHLGDADLVLTVSAVPTVSGQRVVVTLAPHRPEPPALSDLGMSEAESRALDAMVERGRGILLVCAPVAAGRSTTYYSLIGRAAAVGKTVYSVERSIDYEIPAVAQVMVDPGSAAGAAAHLAAGLQQDTDVVAVDGLQAAEEIHLAVEAAGMGKLVVATFAAGDVASGVRRMLDIGAEPVSLASALTLGVGQRLVRTNCPNCTVERRSELAASIPGLGADFTERAGAGCPNCGNTGFRGMTGVFEVLPFTEPVRATVARDPSAETLSAAAAAAGMRPLQVSGLEKAREGVVSLEELDRVLRMS